MMRNFSSRMTINFGGISPMVRNLIIANVAVFIVCLVVPDLQPRLMLTPQQLFKDYAVWQLFTYMYMHASVNHLFWNMVMLWMFGTQVENSWGARRFLSYYTICGLGGALAMVLLGPHSTVSTLVASGAIFGVMVAFGMLFAESTILIMFIIPMKAKYAVMLFVGLELLFTMEAASVNGHYDAVAHLCHLGGALTGFLYYRYNWRAKVWLHNVSNANRAPAMPRRRELAAAPARSRTLDTKPRNAEEAALQKKVDGILDKIASEGMDALTQDEKSLLEQASRRLRELESGPLNLDDYR